MSNSNSPSPYPQQYDQFSEYRKITDNYNLLTSPNKVWTENEISQYLRLTETALGKINDPQYRNFLLGFKSFLEGKQNQIFRKQWEESLRRLPALKPGSERTPFSGVQEVAKERQVTQFEVRRELNFLVTALTAPAAFLGWCFEQINNILSNTFGTRNSISQREAEQVVQETKRQFQGQARGFQRTEPMDIDLKIPRETPYQFEGGRRFPVSRLGNAKPLEGREVLQPKTLIPKDPEESIFIEIPSMIISDGGYTTVSLAEAKRRGHFRTPPQYQQPKISGRPKVYPEIHHSSPMFDDFGSFHISTGPIIAPQPRAQQERRSDVMRDGNAGGIVVDGNIGRGNSFILQGGGSSYASPGNTAGGITIIGR